MARRKNAGGGPLLAVCVIVAGLFFAWNVARTGVVMEIDPADPPAKRQADENFNKGFSSVFQGMLGVKPD